MILILHVWVYIKKVIIHESVLGKIKLIVFN